MPEWNPAADVDNDGRWPDGRAVEVRYPLRPAAELGGPVTGEQMAALRAERETWPWLAGEIGTQCGPDEWAVIVTDDRLATLEDGSPAPEGTPDDEVYWPRCFRDSSEIREPQRQAEDDDQILTDAALPAAADYIRDVAAELEQRTAGQ